MPNKDIAISIRGLSKAYTIRSGGKPRTFGELVASRLRHPLQRTNSETFWSLKDVSFDVNHGEVVGIIGRNGAGKSTLLKLLSRITEPTAGKISLYGRVGSLLEVGTGFHPELTGRENIYLNGAILGMTRAEIRSQFDAIVDFAEVEKFLETPVKRYSSGMYVRLAFAVAAHLNPEILIIDEVLSVGDAEFQRKCLGKMGEVSRAGRTVLFVSHNMQAVQQLCTRGVLLDKGCATLVGDIEDVVDEYLRSGKATDSDSWVLDGAGKGPLSICRVRATLHGKQPRHSLEVEVELRSVGHHKPAFIAIDITDPIGTAIMQALPTEQPFISEAPAQRCCVRIELPPLVPGRYIVGVWVGSHYSATLDSVANCVTFEILDSPTPSRTVPHTPDHGYLVPNSCAELSRDAHTVLVADGGEANGSDPSDEDASGGVQRSNRIGGSLTCA